MDSTVRQTRDIQYARLLQAGPEPGLDDLRGLMGNIEMIGYQVYGRHW